MITGKGQTFFCRLRQYMVSVCLHKISRCGCCEFVYGRQYRRCRMLFSVWIWCWLLMAAVVLCSRGSRPSSSMCLKSIWSLVLREQRAHWEPPSLHRIVKYKSFKMLLFLIFLHLDHLQHQHLFLYLYIFFFLQPRASRLSQLVFSLWWSNWPQQVAHSSTCGISILLLDPSLWVSALNKYFPQDVGGDEINWHECFSAST